MNNLTRTFGCKKERNCFVARGRIKDPRPRNVTARDSESGIKSSLTSRTQPSVVYLATSYFGSARRICYEFAILSGLNSTITLILLPFLERNRTSRLNKAISPYFN